MPHTDMSPPGGPVGGDIGGAPGVGATVSRNEKVGAFVCGRTGVGAMEAEEDRVGLGVARSARVGREVAGDGATGDSVGLSMLRVGLGVERFVGASVAGLDGRGVASCRDEVGSCVPLGGFVGLGVSGGDLVGLGVLGTRGGFVGRGAGFLVRGGFVGLEGKLPPPPPVRNSRSMRNSLQSLSAFVVASSRACA